MCMAARKISVEVVYADSQQQLLVAMQVPENCTVETVIQQSEILKQFPEIDLAVNHVGIFSRLVTLNTVVEEGDRIEIYRPLLIDPKQARRQRARQQTKR
jgi:putative ubiquitin-RnfH superfamily antitoxin RatB of RatAB toxin-antitoxin module